MSVKALTWAFEQKLKPPEKIVLLALADHADDDWECHPGQQRLADKCSLQRTTISSIVGRLEEGGLVRRERRTRDNGSRTSDRYFIGPMSAGPTLVSPTEAMSARQGDNVGATGGPEPSGNHQKEDSSKDERKSTPIGEVWEHYVKVFSDVVGKSTRAMKLTEQRRRIIKNGLKAVDGDLDLVKRAIVGLRHSPYHNGENEQRKQYLDVRYALKGNSQRGEGDDERIEKMARLAPVNGILVGDTGGLSEARIRLLVDQVEQAIEFNGNAAIVDRGAQAKRQLEQAGFKLKRQGTKVRLGR